MNEIKTIIIARNGCVCKDGGQIWPGIDIVVYGGTSVRSAGLLSDFACGRWYNSKQELKLCLLL